jgi:hypothetical protein
LLIESLRGRGFSTEDGLNVDAVIWDDELVELASIDEPLPDLSQEGTEFTLWVLLTNSFLNAIAGKEISSGIAANDLLQKNRSLIGDLIISEYESFIHSGTSKPIIINEQSVFGISWNELRSRVAAFQQTGVKGCTLPSLSWAMLPKKSGVKSLSSWFHQNFQDPTQNILPSGKKGAYLYINGGPYEADEIIKSVFEGWVLDEIIDETLDALNNESHEWVPAHNRVVTLSDFASMQQSKKAQIQPTETEQAHNTLHQEIENLKREIAQIRQEYLQPETAPPRWHNSPPEIIDDIDTLESASHAIITESLTAPNNDVISKAINDLKSVRLKWKPIIVISTATVATNMTMSLMDELSRHIAVRLKPYVDRVFDAAIAWINTVF